MDLAEATDLDIKRRLALIFGALGFILTFRLNSLLLFIGLTLFSGFIGYLLGFTNQRIDKRIYRYSMYFLILLIFTITILVVIGTQYTGCQAYGPYEAENIFTGETQTFNHGGCGERTSHPWYYRVTDTNVGASFLNQTR